MKEAPDANNPGTTESSADGPTATGDTAELARTKAALEKAQQELLYQRAEYENTKRRIMREQDTAIRYANEKIVAELTGVLDLMDRAIASGEALRDKPETSNFMMGVEMTQRELVQILNRFGVEFTGAKGERFDPSKHEAISQAETDPDRVDTVLEVAQRGCSLQGRLVKPAKVVVGIARAK